MYKYAISDLAVSGSLVNLTLSYTYGKETVPQWDAHPVFPVTEDLNISLSLDAAGNVNGGDYAEFDRPDFAWSMQVADFSGYFTQLRTIYQASTNSSGAAKQPLLRAVPPHRRPGHMRLAGRGTVSVGPYTAAQRRSWALVPAAGGSVKLDFAFVDTERQYDMVRVYELSADGTQLGALLRVLHGRMQTPLSFLIHGPVYVSFAAHGRTRGGQGFEFTYA